MFDFINNYFTNELKRLFTVHTSVDSHKTRSSQIFHISKARTLKSGMDALITVVLKCGTSFILTSSTINNV